MTVQISHTQIHRSRRKTMALIVRPDGSLMVRAPLQMPEAQILEFVERNADWIHRKQEVLKARAAIAAAPRKFIAGEQFLYLGQSYSLEIGQKIKGSPPLIWTEGGFILAGSVQSRAAAVFEDWYHQQARKVFAERVEFYARKTGLRPDKLRLSSARTRWGSCSSAGTVSLSWRLIMAPPAVLDYVIVHELVHLREKNHAAGFWTKVGKILPDYQKQRAWLKENGRFLNLD